MNETEGTRSRTLVWWQFLLVAVVYVAIIQIGSLIVGTNADKTLEEPGAFFERMIGPIAASALFAIGIATWLGWWKEILHEPRRVQRWVWIVPILLVLGAMIGASWGNLFDQNTQLVLGLVLLVLIVGFTEELMFRGIGVVSFRRSGMTEVKVALYTSLIFGAVHLSNAISSGSSALLQATVVSVTGYFFYLTRRVSGTIIVAMLVHSTQDFTYLSGQIGIDPSTSNGLLVMFPVMLGLAIAVAVRRKKIEPETGPGQ